MRIIRAISNLMVVAAIAATGSLDAANDEWPQWRGPHRTGIVAEAAAPSAWPPELKKGWSVAIGEGYASPVTGDGRVFVHSRQDPEEVVSAIDLVSGRVVWEKKYRAPVEKNPYAKQMAKGPYSTPLLTEGRLYTVGTTGILSGWDASTGSLGWRKDFSSSIDTSKLFCGTAMSPVRTKHGIVVQVGDDRRGTVAAFEPATGKEVWSTEGRAGTGASVIAAGKHLVFLTTESELVVAQLDRAAYTELHRYDVASSATYAHPILLRDRMIVRDATHLTLWSVR